MNVLFLDSARTVPYRRNGHVVGVNGLSGQTALFTDACEALRALSY
jgi:hypothetical protein